jgi:hypothetical protein
LPIGAMALTNLVMSAVLPSLSRENSQYDRSWRAFGDSLDTARHFGTDPSIFGDESLRDCNPAEQRPGNMSRGSQVLGR